MAWFGRRGGGDDGQGKARLPPQAPPVAFGAAARGWFEIWGAVTVERNRYFLLCIVLAVAVTALAAALAVLVPLRRVVPYVVKVADTGAVTVAPSAAQEYVPGQAEKAYFLARWVSNLLTLDPYLTERQLTEAYGQTRALATGEFVDWLRSNRPLEQLRREPSLVRTVAINTVTPLQEDVVQVRVRTETRSLAQSPEVRRFQVTIRYTVQPPATEAQIIKNPIGLFVTHFAINEELAG